MGCKMIDFLCVIHGPNFYFQRRFGNWIVSPVCCTKKAHSVDPIDRASPYLWIQGQSQNPVSVT